jgi:hypothetical protein
MDSAIEEALEGRVSVGRSRGGRKDCLLSIVLSERAVYRLQTLLERRAIESDNWFEVREVVLLAEELRVAVERAGRGTRSASNNAAPQGV